MVSRNIYIVLSRSDTIPARIIRGVTNDRYSHVSLSLDNSLETMYSFGRLTKYNPFIGGFVVESKNRGIYQRFKDTEIKILCLSVPSSKYKKLRRKLKFVEKHRDRYSYNYIGVILAAFNINFKHSNLYYCSEFIHRELVKTGMIKALSTAIVRPINFENLKQTSVVYTGLLREYIPVALG